MVKIFNNKPLDNWKRSQPHRHRKIMTAVYQITKTPVCWR